MEHIIKIYSILCEIYLDSSKLSIFTFRHRKYILIPKLDEIVSKNVGSGFPSVGDLEKRSILAIVSTNPALDNAEPLPPNVIPVAGLHIAEPKPLPDHIESFINRSKKGTVLFSLGTNILSEHMDKGTQKKTLDAFDKMTDYNFLWKFEGNKTLVPIPENVMISKWLPQSDILAHPKVKGFFTHGGLLSTQEAIWNAVPMVGMPFIFDQHRVIKYTFNLILN